MTTVVGQIKDEGAIATRLPEPKVCEKRRQSGSSPQQHQIEKTRIASAEQHANAVYGSRQQED